MAFRQKVTMMTDMLRTALFACLVLGCGGSDEGAAPAGDGGVDAKSDGSAGDAPLEDAGTVSTCWKITFPTINDYGTALRLHPSGDVIVEGEFQGEIDLGGTKLTAGPAPDGGYPAAAFVARLRKSDGKAVWARLVGATTQVRLQNGALSIDPTGNPVIGGFFTGTIDDLGGLTAADPQGGAFLARLDGETGKMLVARALDTSSGTQHIARASDGSYVAAGTYGDYARIGPTPLKTSASTDVWITRLALEDPTNVRWAVRVGDGGADSIRGLALTATDDVLIGGGLRSSGSIDDRVHVAKLSGVDGTVAWEHDYSGAKPVPTTLVVTVGDEVALFGTMVAATAIGGDPIPVDKSTETIWLGRWAIADGAYRGSARIMKSSSNEERAVEGGPTSSGTLWYLSQSGLHTIDKSGTTLTSVKPGAQTGGDYDIANGRWYSISQGSIVCSELH
jgi:hypothetical protein